MAARDFPKIKAIRSYVIGGVGSGEIKEYHIFLPKMGMSNTF